ncbi:hypothetical protein RVR_1518 [Actinacidiphila reveromycinica]|uniref:Fe/B12 periplasmic-binding domain-containing protein n=1 Tax=Actinacidiphila reveromycinica TaxID=659352 RepID=A0A7U3UPC4_9ACTN|nr:hypothetical protein RVR_1518 [Streptomyces sp. SN-593]
MPPPARQAAGGRPPRAGSEGLDKLGATGGHFSRRGFLGTSAGAAALLGLSGCGSSSSPASSSSPTGGHASGSRTVATLHGDVKVPADPQRIVALQFPEACALLDVGVRYVGRPDYMPAFDTYTKADASVARVVDTSGAPDLEKIAGLRPDLIITSDWKDPKLQQQPYARLAEIAPTLVFEWQKAAGNWRAEAVATAAAVGRTARLDALKKSYADACASIRSQYAKVLAATRWDLVDGNGSVWDLYGPNSSHGRVLVDAGVRLAAGATQKDGFVEHSLEDMSSLLGGTDVLFTTGVSLAKLRTEQVFKKLPAVQHSDVFTSDLFFPASYGIAIALLADVRKVCARLATRI